MGLRWSESCGIGSSILLVQALLPVPTLFTDANPSAASEVADFVLSGGPWDIVNRVLNRITILITPIRVLITSCTKFHDPPNTGNFALPISRLLSGPRLLGLTG